MAPARTEVTAPQEIIVQIGNGDEAELTIINRRRTGERQVVRLRNADDPLLKTRALQGEPLVGPDD